MTMIDNKTDVPMVVTTQHRGVFFGYGQYCLREDNSILLKRARMCLYWPAANKGVVGLAVEGPLQESRVGPAAPSILLTSVTALMLCTAAAVQKWEKAPWS